MPRKTVKSAAAPKAAAKGGVKSVVRAAAKVLAAPATAPAPKKPAAKTPAVKKAAARPSTKPVKIVRVVTAPERIAAPEERPTLVRDSFTMPEQEYAVLHEVKMACLRAGIDVKKSELLRIGVALLGQLDVNTLQTVLAGLPQLKTGRPPAGG